MTPMRLLMVCIATVAAALFGACGTDQPESNDKPAEADVAGTKTSACADLVGQTMTADFEGCESEGRFIEAIRTECADGRILIAPDLATAQNWTEAQIGESVWGFVGQPIQASAGDGGLYATMFVDCNEF